MKLTIGVLYSCKLCGLKNVEVRIPAREVEDIIDWMHKTLEPGVGADHGLRSPHCHPEKLSDIKIPTTGTDRVGGAPVQ